MHGTRIDRGASDIEAYESTWRYLIAVELAQLALTKSTGTSNWLPEIKQLKSFLNDNYGGSATISEILRPKNLKLSKASFEPTVLGCKLGSIALDRNPSDFDLGHELNALTKQILEAVFVICDREGIEKLLLHFDELDQGLSDLDTQREKMLIGLILAARHVRQIQATIKTTINPLVYLRSDIWEKLSFSDKNKISQTSAILIEWTNQTLLELIDTRIKNKSDGATSWLKLIDESLMRGSQEKWNHIISRTFLRPRDVISFLNSALKYAKKRNTNTGPLIFNNADIIEARIEYSLYLKSELDDEILPHWTQWEDALQACSAIGTVSFTKDDFSKSFEKVKRKNNTVGVDEALEKLYQFSVISYATRSGYGGSSWVARYTDPQAGWDANASKFKVHLGLKEFAKLKEERTS